MKYGVTQSRNFTVEAISEDEAIQKMTNKWGTVSSNDIKDGIKLDTVTMSVYSLDDEKNKFCGSCKITYHGQLIIKVGGAGKTFYALFMDSEGNKIEGIEARWEMYLSPNLDMCQLGVCIQPNKIDIAAYKDAALGSKILLKAIADSEKYGYFEDELEICIDGLW